MRLRRAEIRDGRALRREDRPIRDARGPTSERLVCIPRRALTCVQFPFPVPT
jgi:hypothetical protein